MKYLHACVDIYIHVFKQADGNSRGAEDAAQCAEAFLFIVYLGPARRRGRK
jgi:hypothetical protein